MLVQEAKELLQKMPLEDVREIVRKEFLTKDVGTLADICITLFEDEQLLEWAVPAVLAEEKAGKPVTYGKLNEAAIKRAIPSAVVSDGLLRVSLLESISTSNQLFIKHSIRLVAEGMEGDGFLMGVYAPIVEEEEVVKVGYEGEVEEKCKKCGEETQVDGNCLCAKCGGKIAECETPQPAAKPCPACNKTLLQDEEDQKRREELAQRQLDIAANPTVNMPDPAHTSDMRAPLPMAPKGKSR
ncbi:MAG: hypothetical protein Q8K86_11485 [Candidatus Nanopelagicaceae bacterium]|nr:hypothetical protein [Candidatus Nanopelagicaceae bacterium]